MKAVRITFSNGERYDVPARVIAEHRARYYAEKYEGEEGEYDEIFEKEMWVLDDRLELLDWFSNNMNWEDVEDVAVQVEGVDIDKSEEFVNAEKEVIEDSDELEE